MVTHWNPLFMIIGSAQRFLPRILRVLADSGGFLPWEFVALPIAAENAKTALARFLGQVFAFFRVFFEKFGQKRNLERVFAFFGPKRRKLRVRGCFFFPFGQVLGKVAGGTLAGASRISCRMPRNRPKLQNWAEFGSLAQFKLPRFRWKRLRSEVRLRACNFSEPVALKTPQSRELAVEDGERTKATKHTPVTEVPKDPNYHSQIESQVLSKIMVLSNPLL